jgi:hypothetical protein
MKKKSIARFTHTGPLFVSAEQILHGTTSVTVLADDKQPIALKAVEEQVDAQAGMPLLPSN